MKIQRPLSNVQNPNTEHRTPNTENRSMYPPEVYKSYLTPFRFLQRSAAVFRQKVAVIHGDQRITYPELAARVNRLASALRGAGIERGDRVAVLLPNIPQMLEAHFGVPLSGAIM